VSKENQNYWSVYIGQALTDRNVAPVTVVVTETFHKCLLSGNRDAWRMLVTQSEKFIEERETDEGPIY